MPSLSFSFFFFPFLTSMTCVLLDAQSSDRSGPHPDAPGTFILQQEIEMNVSHSACEERYYGRRVQKLTNSDCGVCERFPSSDISGKVYRIYRAYQREEMLLVMIVLLWKHMWSLGDKRKLNIIKKWEQLGVAGAWSVIKEGSLRITPLEPVSNVGGFRLHLEGGQMLWWAHAFRRTKILRVS